MNKKKLLTLAMVLAMVAILAIGGTIAYFTDSDADVNVMTTGNLNVIQNETDREGDAYVDGQKLVPAIYFDEDGKQYNPTALWQGPDGGVDGTYTGPDGEEDTIYDESINNEIDKIVSVTNNGTEDAFVRTLVLIEDNYNELEDYYTSDYLHIVYSDVPTREIIDQVEVDGEMYEVWVFTYEEAVKAGTTSGASLKQVWLDPMADNSWYDSLGEEPALTIIALSQATQSYGFEELGATVALDAAFGDVTKENIAKWVVETGVKTTGRMNVVGGGEH